MSEPMMIWRIWQDVNDGYDTYDSAIVAARSEDEARKIHPGSSNADWWKEKEEPWDSWTHDLAKISVEWLGTAKARLGPGVILASFNAG